LQGLKLLFPLGRWHVVLTSGESIDIRADAYSRENGKDVFTILIEGRPLEFVVATFPSDVVDRVWGGGLGD
jgi:hypothetical protein